MASTFLITVVAERRLIPYLRARAAQPIYEGGPSWHLSKSGTPTMGGLCFCLAAAIAALLFSEKITRTLLVTVTVGLSYMLVGLLDDLLKLKRKENLGLTPAQKIVFQTLVALLAGIYCLRAELTTLNIPFFRISVDVGWWILPVSVFVFLAAVNCVNLTDGLDGLAASTCIPFFLFMGLIIYLQTKGQLTSICLSLVGALLGYLLFNTSPASVFMGDTGSLSLGGFAACIGVFSGNALYIAVIGIMFVVSGISVILQVIYYKATGGKRIFKMAPVHHHFQQLGYSETKISAVYAAVTAIVGIAALFFELS
jgi:phospho-N-acetylmuramoyl-pentapeptide-transferase